MKLKIDRISCEIAPEDRRPQRVRFFVFTLDRARGRATDAHHAHDLHEINKKILKTREISRHSAAHTAAPSITVPFARPFPFPFVSDRTAGRRAAAARPVLVRHRVRYAARCA